MGAFAFLAVAKVKRVPGPAFGPLQKALKTLDDAVGKVGWFQTAHYPDGTPVAYVAAIHEFGVPEKNIPPRLGMRATADEKRGEWAKVSEVGAKRILNGQATPWEVMETIGLKAAGDVRKHIANVTSPPLKADTVKARLAGKKQGNVVSVTIAKPLVHTGELLGSLTNTVEAKGSQ